MKQKKEKKTKINKNRVLITILCLCVCTCVVLTINVLIPFYKNYKEKKEKEEYLQTIKNATIIVNLKEDLNVEFMSSIKVSDFIEEINGKITSDDFIETNVVGPKEVHFEYINDDNILIPYSFEINIVDTTPPTLWLGDTKTVTEGITEEDLYEKITCADNYDDNPDCKIVGNYNLNRAGNYKLKYTASDNSGNKTEKDFTLIVNKPSSGGSSTPSKRTGYHISDIIKDYKTENTKIGIDVSGWQGDIDFQAVKDAGVEFVFIRVGSTKGINAEYFVDSKFKRNIEGFNEVGIPVGIYFYSYANSEESAINDAKWVIEQLEGYKVDLPVAYDWENWSFYNNFHQSFYSTTRNAKAFLDTLNEAGYDGLLYSSASYLKKVWYDTSYPVWMAHYTDHSDYDGEYKYWQFCSNGKVPGINGFVDMNIMYIDK